MRATTASRSGLRRLPEPRQVMIAETNRFLTWALDPQRRLPPIPRRTVATGGYGPLLQLPGARALVERWWLRTLAADWWSQFIHAHGRNG